MAAANRGPDFIDLAPAARASGTVALPGSKSISNRTLLLAALARGDTIVRGLLDADDVERMLDALAALGIDIEPIAQSRDYRVRGLGGRVPVKAATLFLGNAGTAFRPLTAVLAFAGGSYDLSGVARMHERPIGDLVDALRALGANIDYLSSPGFPPLRVRPDRGDAAAAPDRVTVRGRVSSQFTSALLMALPAIAQRRARPITLDIDGELISKPYVAITTNLMHRFGVAVSQDGWRSFTVPAGARFESPGEIRVEGDASTASYFLAAGALGGGPVRVTGVGRASIQGDVGFADVLERMGAAIERGDDWIEARSGARGLSGLDVDCVAIPDAAMTLAVVALFAQGATTLTGIASWRVKETDRIAAMATELAKLGAKVDAGDDRMTIVPPARLEAATIDTYDDHRIAMCFALAALGGVQVRIMDPDCVRKTFPGFFATLRAIAS
jgi:3-phosphoshikimate 1-carboxyvinyltransferase